MKNIKASENPSKRARTRHPIGDAGLEIARAILSLRQKLGKSQQQMIAELRVSIGAFRKWEEEGKIPLGAVALLKMVKMCPDQETRSLFGIKPIGISTEKIGTKVSLTQGEGGPILTLKRRKALREAEDVRFKPRFIKVPNREDGPK